MPEKIKKNASYLSQVKIWVEKNIKKLRQKDKKGSC